LTVALCAAAVPTAQESFEDARAILEFQRAADSYAFMHRVVERKLAAEDELVTGLRAARPNARPGSFFTPAAQTAFRNRLAKLLRNPDCAADLEKLAQRGAGATLQVQDQFPPDLDDATGTCVARGLPHLPDELQYAVLGHDLLLIDRHARIVLDVLADSFGSDRHDD
jgi:hypothetical protein